MKSGMTTLVAGFSLLIAGTYWASGDHIKFKELPDAVQKTITSHKSNRMMGHIEKELQDGKTVYQVEFRRWGKNPVLRIAEDGSLLEEATTAYTRGETPATRDSRSLREQTTPARWAALSLTELPEAVQMTVRAQGAEVADIDKETWNGKTVYEVEFKSEGKNPQIYVTEDGTLVKEERAGTPLGEIFLGTQMKDLPAPVQNSIKTQVGSDRIVDIDKEMRTGRPVYEVQFEREGKNTKIHLAEDGSLLQPSSTAVRVREALGLKKLQMSELPPAVQNTIKTEAVGAEVGGIDKETTAGRTVYDVELKKEGKNIKLQIAEDGSVVKDSRR